MYCFTNNPKNGLLTLNVCFAVGIMHDSGESAFARGLIKRMFEHPPFQTKTQISHVFVAIDPNAGGDSRFGICSAFYRQGKMIIAGLDAVKSKSPSAYEPVLLDHINKLRSQYITANCLIVVMVENNLGFESYHIERFIKRTPARSYTCFMTDKDQKVGLRTTNPIKESMWIKFKTFLEEDAVFFWEHLVSASDSYTLKEMKKQLKDELINYKVMVELPKTVFQQTKRTYTGKIGGAMDDMSVTIQLNALCKLKLLRAVLFPSHIYLLFTQGILSSTRQNMRIIIKII